MSLPSMPPTPALPWPTSFFQGVKRELQTPAWQRSLMIWLVLNLLLSGMGVLAWRLNSPLRPAELNNLWGTTPIDEGPPGALEGVWLRWDALHYYHIAQHGYDTEVVSAFFPLYPLLGRATGWLLGGDNLGGLLLVSRLAFLFALVMLYKLTAGLFDDKTATAAILCAAFYPLGVYWFAPYPLALALLLSLLCLQSALHKHWLAATLFGLAAGLTHGTTVPLALALLTLWFQQTRKEHRSWLLLPATASPLLGTAMFLAWRSMNGFADFNAVQAKYWTRVVQPPWMIVGDFQRFFTAYLGHGDGWVDMLLFVFAAGMTIVVLRKLPAAFSVYQVSLLLFICSTAMYNTPFGSMGRFLLIAFPVYIAAGLMVPGKWGRLALFSLGLFSYLFLAVVYFQWGWLA
jgi:hypothetical protein